MGPRIARGDEEPDIVDETQLEQLKTCVQHQWPDLAEEEIVRRATLLASGKPLDDDDGFGDVNSEMHGKAIPIGSDDDDDDDDGPVVKLLPAPKQPKGAGLAVARAKAQGPANLLELAAAVSVNDTEDKKEPKEPPVDPETLTESDLKRGLISRSDFLAANKELLATLPAECQPQSHKIGKKTYTLKVCVGTPQQVATLEVHHTSSAYRICHPKVEGRGEKGPLVKFGDDPIAAWEKTKQRAKDAFENLD